MPIPSKKENIQRQSVKNTVYETVCVWIITGTLKPGEKILDTELADYFGVSRTPVREALQILENQRLIRMVPGKATVVADIDLEDIEKCYRPLAEVQAIAASMAAEKITQMEMAKLEEEVKAFSFAADSEDALAAINHDSRFHEIIMDASDNEYISDFSHMLILHIQRIKYHYFHLSGYRRLSSEEHKAILEAIRKKDSSRAHALMRTHWLNSMERSFADFENKARFLFFLTMNNSGLL